MRFLSNSFFCVIAAILKPAKIISVIFYTPSVQEWLWDCWCAVKNEVVDNPYHYNRNLDHITEDCAVWIQLFWNGGSNWYRNHIHKIVKVFVCVLAVIDLKHKYFIPYKEFSYKKCQYCVISSHAHIALSQYIPLVCHNQGLPDHFEHKCHNLLKLSQHCHKSWKKTPFPP